MKVTRNYFLSSTVLLLIVLWIFIGGPLLLRGSSEYQAFFWLFSALLTIPVVLFLAQRRFSRWLNNRKDKK